MPITNLDALKQIQLMRKGYSQDAAAQTVMQERLSKYAERFANERPSLSAVLNPKVPVIGTGQLSKAPNTSNPAIVNSPPQTIVSPVRNTPSAYTAPIGAKKPLPGDPVPNAEGVPPVQGFPGVTAVESKPAKIPAYKMPEPPKQEPTPTAPKPQGLTKEQQEGYDQFAELFKPKSPYMQPVSKDVEKRMQYEFQKYGTDLSGRPIKPLPKESLEQVWQKEAELQRKAEIAKYEIESKKASKNPWDFTDDEIVKIRESIDLQSVGEESNYKYKESDPFYGGGKNSYDLLKQMNAKAALDITGPGGYVEQFLKSLRDIDDPKNSLASSKSNYILQNKLKGFISDAQYNNLEQQYNRAVIRKAVNVVLPKYIAGYDVTDPKAGEKLKALLQYNVTKDRPFGFIPQALGMTEQQFAYSALLPKFSSSNVKGEVYGNSPNEIAQNLFAVVNSKKGEHPLEIAKEHAYNQDLYSLNGLLREELMNAMIAHQVRINDSDKQSLQTIQKINEDFAKGKISQAQGNALLKAESEKLQATPRIDDQFMQIVSELVDPSVKAKTGHVKYDLVERVYKEQSKRQEEYDQVSGVPTSVSAGTTNFSTGVGGIKVGIGVKNVFSSMYGTWKSYALEKEIKNVQAGKIKDFSKNEIDNIATELADIYIQTKKYPLIDKIASSQAGRPISASQFFYFDKDGGWHLGDGFAIEGPEIMIDMGIMIAGTGLIQAGLGAGVIARGARYAKAAESVVGAARLERYKTAIAQATNAANKVSKTQVWRNFVQASAAATSNPLARTAISWMESRMPQFVGTYATSFPGIYRHTLNDLYDNQVANAENVALKMAAVSAFIEALTESFIPDIDYFTGGAGRFFKETGLGADRIVNAVGLGGMKARLELLKMLPLNPKTASVIAKMSYGATRGAQEILKYGKTVSKLGFSAGEGFEEVVAEVGGYFNELAFADQTKREPEDINAESLINAFTGGAFLTGPVGVLGLLKGGVKQIVPNFASYHKEEELQTAFRMALNPKIYQAEIQRQLDKGRIDEQTAAKALSRIQQYEALAKSKEFTNLRDMDNFLEDRDKQYMYFRAVMNEKGIQDAIQNHGDKLNENQRNLLLATAKEAQKDIDRYVKQSALYEDMTDQDKENKMMEWVNNRTKSINAIPYSKLIEDLSGQKRERAIAEINQRDSFPRIGKVMDAYIGVMDAEIIARNKAIIEARENGELNPLMSEMYAEIDSQNPNSKEVRTLDAKSIDEVESAFLQTLANPDTANILPEFFQQSEMLANQKEIEEAVVLDTLDKIAKKRGVDKVAENELTKAEEQELIDALELLENKLSQAADKQSKLFDSLLKMVSPSLQLNLFSQKEVEDLLFGERSKILQSNALFVHKNYDTFSHETRVNLPLFHQWLTGTVQERADLFNELERLEQEEEQRRIQEGIKAEQKKQAEEKKKAEEAAQAVAQPRTTTDGNLEVFTQLTDFPTELFDELREDLTNVEYHNLVGKILRDYVIAADREQFDLRLKYLMSLVDPQNAEAFINEVNSILAVSPVTISTNTALKEISPVVGLKFSHLLDSELQKFGPVLEAGAEIPLVEETVIEETEPVEEEKVPLSEIDALLQQYPEISVDSNYAIVVPTPELEEGSKDYEYARRQLRMMKEVQKSPSSYGVRILDFHSFLKSTVGKKGLTQFKKLYQKAKAAMATEMTENEKEQFIKELREEYNSFMPAYFPPSEIDYIFNKFILGDLSGLELEVDKNPSAQEIFRQHEGKKAKGGTIVGYDAISNSVKIRRTTNGVTTITLENPETIGITTYIHPPQTFASTNFVMYVLTSKNKNGRDTNTPAKFNNEGIPDKNGSQVMTGKFIRDPQYRSSGVSDQLRRVIESEGSVDVHSDITGTGRGPNTLGFIISEVEIPVITPIVRESKVEEAIVPTQPSDIKDKKADIERRRQEDLQNAVIFLINDGTYGGSKDFSLSEYLNIQAKENGEKFNVDNWKYINVNGTGVFFIKEEGVAYIIPNNTYNKNPRVVKLFFNKGTQRIDLSDPSINTPNLKQSAQSDKVNYDSLLQEVQSVIQPLDAELAALEGKESVEPSIPVTSEVVEKQEPELADAQKRIEELEQARDKELAEIQDEEVDTKIKTTLDKEMNNLQKQQEELNKKILEVEEEVNKVLSDIDNASKEHQRIVDAQLETEELTAEEKEIAKNEKSENETVDQYIKKSFRNYLKNLYKGKLVPFFQKIKDKVRKTLLAINLSAIIITNVTGNLGIRGYIEAAKNYSERHLIVKEEAKLQTVQIKSTDNRIADNIGLNKIMYKTGFASNQIINLDSNSFEPRNRNDRRPVNQAVGITTNLFKPFYEVGEFKGVLPRKDAETKINPPVVAVNKQTGKVKAGNLKDFNNEWLVSETFAIPLNFESDKNGKIETVYHNQAMRNVPITIVNGKKVPFPIGLDTKDKRINPNAHNTFGVLEGGKVILVVGKYQLQVNGGFADIYKVWQQLKKSNPGKEIIAYLLDNGSYNLPILKSNGVVEKEDFVAHTLRNKDGGTSLVLKQKESQESKKYVHGFQKIETNNYRKDSSGNKAVNKPEFIVLHHTGEYKEGEKAVIEEFTSPHGNSAHYLIGKDGKIYQFNDGSYIMFHAGKSLFKGKTDLNSKSIGIEIQGDSKNADFTKEQYEALSQLLPEIAKTYSIAISNIVSHAEIRENYIKAHPEDKEVKPKRDLEKIVFDNIIKAVQTNFPKYKTEDQGDAEIPLSNILGILAAMQGLNIAARSYKRKRKRTLRSIDTFTPPTNITSKQVILAKIQELQKSLSNHKTSLEKLKQTKDTNLENITRLQSEIEKQIEIANKILSENKTNVNRRNQIIEKYEALIRQQEVSVVTEETPLAQISVSATKPIRKVSPAITTIYSSPLEQTTAVVEDLIARSAVIGEPVDGLYTIEGENYMRQSEFNNQTKDEEDAEVTNQLMQNGATVGDYVDLVGREAVLGIVRPGETPEIISSYQNDVAAKQNPNGSNSLFIPLNVSEKAHILLTEQFLTFKQAVEESGGKVYTDRIVVYRKFKKTASRNGTPVVGVAGVIDMCVVDKSGQVHIVDMKNFSSSGIIPRTIGVDFNQKQIAKEFNDSRREPKWRTQQATYAVLARGLMPKVKSINIYGVASSYLISEDGSSLEVRALSRIDSLRPNPDVPLVTRLNNNEEFKRSIEDMFEARKDITFEKEITEYSNPNTIKTC